MANETKIDQLVAQSAYDQLLKLDKMIKETNASFSKAANEMAKGLSFNPQTMSELIEKQKTYIENLRDVQNATKEYNRLQQEKERITRAAAASIVEQLKAEKEAAIISKEQSRIELERSKTSLNLSQAKKNAARATEEEARSQVSSAKATENAAKAEQIFARNAQLSAEEVDQLITKLETANLTYKEQAKILSQLKNYSKSQPGGIDVVPEKTIQSLQKLDKELKRQDELMGIYGRNVGNYKSHWDGLGNSIANITREMPAFAVSMNVGFLALSNNIPILADEIARVKRENAELVKNGQTAIPLWKQLAAGIFSWQTALSIGVTVLTIYGAKIFEFAETLYKSGDASKAAGDALKDLASSSGKFFEELKKSTGTYGENIVSIKKLQSEWSLLGDSLDKKKQFVIDNESEFKKLDVSITNVNDAENILVKNTDAFIEALKKRAMANAGEKLATDKYAEALQKRVEADNKRAKVDEIVANNEISLFQNLQDTRYGEIKSREQLSEQYANSTKLDVKNLDEEAEALEMAASAYFDYSQKANEAYKTDLEKAGIDEYTNAEKLKRQQEAAEREAKQRQKLEMEAERNLLESRLKIMDEGYEKERAIREASYQKRIDDVKTKGVRVNEQIKAIEAERQKDLSDFERDYNQKRAEEDAKNRIEIAKKGSLQELKAKLDLLNIEKENELREAEKTEISKTLIEDKYLKKIEDLHTDFAKRQFNRTQAQNEINLSERQIVLNKELAILSKQYTEGEVKKEAYEKKKADIQYKYAVEAINKELSFLESNLDLFQGDERISMEKKIADLRVQLSKTTTDKIIEDGEKEKKAREEIENAKIKFAQEAFNAMGDIGNSIFERRIQDIEEEINKSKEYYDEQISNIDSLAEKDVITKEEAEARKRVAEEQSAARTKELEKQKAELQTRQARFQKTMDIAQTIASTAQGVMKAFAQLGTFAAPVAAMIAAIGAMQLATIIAQPIPKYAHGTEYHPGGLAIVGDGGKKEAILYNGQAYITPSTPTLLPIPRGAEVLPDINSDEFRSRLFDNSYFLTHNTAGEPVSITNNFDVDGIIRSNEKIEKSINYLAKITMKGQKDAAFEAYKQFKMK